MSSGCTLQFPSTKHFPLPYFQKWDCHFQWAFSFGIGEVWWMTICGKAEGIPWWILSLGSSKAKNPKVRMPPRVFGLRTSRGNIFTRIVPRLFHILPFFRNPALVTGILWQPILPLGSILVNIPPRLLQYWQCLSHYAREGFKKNA